MTNIGIVRKVDSLGRVTLPKELRRMLHKMPHSPAPEHCLSFSRCETMISIAAMIIKYAKSEKPMLASSASVGNSAPRR